jgi:alkylation response protein AidB-like acyl-CoA dehydrogenase
VVLDFAVTPEDRRFGAEVRAFVERSVPRDWQVTHSFGSHEWAELQKEWDRKLYAAGYGGIFWPMEFGGSGATSTQRMVFAQIMAETGAPEGLGHLGKRMVAPILFVQGTREQQQRFLPPILEGREFWAQGFSEPGAGSDLASLSTRAELRDGHFIVTGQKVWTSNAEFSDWCFVLVRTGPTTPKHDGISCLAVRLDSPRVTIVPIRQINRQSDFAEVFFDQVEVPAENLIGRLNEGWRVAMTLLNYERGIESAISRFADQRGAVEGSMDAIRRKPEPERYIDAHAVGRMAAELLAIPIMGMRLLSKQLEGGDPSELSSVLKLQHSNAWQRDGHRFLLAAGQRAQLQREPAESQFLFYLMSRAVSIGGGTSEVQRNVIARRVLGMR